LGPGEALSVRASAPEEHAVQNFLAAAERNLSGGPRASEAHRVRKGGVLVIEGCDRLRGRSAQYIPPVFVYSANSEDRAALGLVHQSALLQRAFSHDSIRTSK